MWKEEARCLDNDGRPRRSIWQSVHVRQQWVRSAYTNHTLTTETVRVVFTASCDSADNVLLLPTRTLRVVCVTVGQGHQRHLCRALVVSWAERLMSHCWRWVVLMCFSSLLFIFFEGQKKNSLLGFYVRESVREPGIAQSTRLGASFTYRQVLSMTNKSCR